MRYNLALNENYTIVDSFYTGGIDNPCTCDNCGRLITNVAKIKDSKGSIFDVGLDCASTLSNIYGLYSVEADFAEMKAIRAKVNKELKSNSLEFSIYSTGELKIANQDRVILYKDIEFCQKYLKDYLEKVTNKDKIGFTYTNKQINLPFSRDLAKNLPNLNETIIVDSYTCLISTKPYNDKGFLDFYIEVYNDVEIIYSNSCTMYSNIVGDINYVIRLDLFNKYK